MNGLYSCSDSRSTTHYSSVVSVSCYCYRFKRASCSASTRETEDRRGLLLIWADDVYGSRRPTVLRTHKPQLEDREKPLENSNTVSPGVLGRNAAATIRVDDVRDGDAAVETADNGTWEEKHPGRETCSLRH